MRHTLSRYFIRFFRYLLPYKKRYIIAFFSWLLAIVFLNIEPYFFKVLIDDVLISKQMSMLWIVLLVMFGAVVIGSVFEFLANYLNAYLRERVALDLTLEMFNKLEFTRLKNIKQKETGNLLTTITDDAQKVEDMAFSLFDYMIPNIFTFVYILAIMLYLNWQLTLLGLIILPFAVMSESHFGKTLTKMSKSLRIVYSHFYSFLEERLTNLKNIQLFSREMYESKILKKKGMDVVQKSISVTIEENIAGYVSTFLLYFSSMLVLGYGGYLVINDQLTIGSLVAISTYFVTLISPLEELFNKYLIMKEEQASASRTAHLLDTLDPITDAKHAITLENPSGIIKFSNVHFRYDDKAILKGASFTIAPGKLVGLIGSSGSGKTTIINLIFRLYDADKGSIKFDDIDIKKIKVDSLRNNISLMEPNPVMFNTTIKNNIKYGNPHATLDQIKKAAKLANIHDTIMQLPHDYNAKVGSYGTRLSEGQKERIGLARVILKDAQVLLLDEATALLDPRNRKFILNSLKTLAKMGKTVLVVTNKESMARGIKELYCLEDGKIKKRTKKR